MILSVGQTPIFWIIKQAGVLLAQMTWVQSNFPFIVHVSNTVVWQLLSRPTISTCLDLLSANVQSETGTYLKPVWFQLIMSSSGMSSIMTMEQISDKLLLNLFKIS